MKYFNFVVLKKILHFNNRGTKAWFLKTATVCTNTFSTNSTHHYKENLSYSGSEKFLWLNTARNRKKKAEDLIPKIITKIEAKPIFFECVYEICDDLKCIFPTAKVTLFGSARSNLALQNADIDVGLYFKEIKVSEELIHIVKHRLRKSRLFTSAVAIFARVPIIKCVHQNGVSCDISFSEHLGFYDNELVKFILGIDSRIRPLILILKFLLRRQELLVNTHSFVVLTVFFLQVIENPLVPPISCLQDAATERKMFDGWDVSFTKEISRLPKVDNQLSVIELLQKFFEFYAAFEFAFHVISTFTAKYYLKPVFAEVDSLPEQFHLYKRKLSEDKSFKFNSNACMCLQGFFNHSANISKNFSDKKVKSFQDYCRVNAAIGQELLNGKEGEEHKVEYLMKLFQENDPENEKSNSLNDVAFALQNVSLEDFNSSVDELRNKWWKYIFGNILEILRDVMDGEVSVKSKELGDGSNLVEEYVISCEMSYWKLATKIRKKVAKDINFTKNLSPIEKEKIISEHLKKTVLENEEKHSYKFDVICGFEKNPTRVCLKIKPLFQNDKFDGFLHQMCSYLSKQIPKWIV